VPPDGRSSLTITAIQTGTGNCHVRQFASPLHLGTIRRRAGILLDKQWTGPHPIYAYLIDHPEGLILVDTGDSSRKSDRGYMPRLNPFFRCCIDPRVAPEEEIGPQLTALGIRSRDLRLTVMTHLHHDHTGGLRHLPHNRILASAECLTAARRMRGLIGAAPRTWPTWFEPEPFTFSGPAIGRFPRSAPLTRDGSILAVSTPGHMTGHVCIIARSQEVTYVLAGDLTYRQDLLLADTVDGVTQNPGESLASQRAIKHLAQSEPTVLLPAHDPGAVNRLADRLTMYPSRTAR
jgi:N-acyl homoserine lactone hydrolase